MPSHEPPHRTAMRVIAGEAKGRVLLVPKGGGTRCATDRIREALFAILEPILQDAVVVDLFAGAGSLGIEALSRGAARATFVEQAHGAIAVLTRNLAATGFTARSTVVRADVLRFLDGPLTADVVFCDPPFADVRAHSAALEKAAAPDRLIVARALRKHLPRIPERLRIARAKEIGEETVLLLQYSGDPAGG